LGKSGSSVSDWVRAIVSVGVNVDGSPDDVVYSVQGESVVGVLIVVVNTVGRVADDSQVSNVSLERRDSVKRVERVVVTRGGKTSGVRDVSPPMKVKSVSSGNSSEDGSDGDWANASWLLEVDDTGGSVSGSGVQNADSSGETGSFLKSLSRSSVNGRVDISDNSLGKSSSRASSRNAIIRKVVQDNSSSNDGVDPVKSKQVKSLSPDDASSNSLPISHVSVMPRSPIDLRASMSRTGRSNEVTGNSSGTNRVGEISKGVDMNPVKRVGVY
jgi:hypothetical protein